MPAYYEENTTVLH